MRLTSNAGRRIVMFWFSPLHTAEQD